MDANGCGKSQERGWVTGIEGTVKFGGGSIMIWGCVTWERVGYAAKIDGRMIVTFTFKFWRMNCLIPWSIMVLILLTSSFSRIMTLSTPLKWSRNGWGSRILGLWCGLQSSDLILIEHLWGYLERRLAEHENPPNGIHELWERVQVIWEEIAALECQNVLKACLGGFRQCLMQKGGTQNTDTLLIFAYYQKLKKCCNELTNLKGTYLYNCFKSYEWNTIRKPRCSTLIHITSAKCDVHSNKRCIAVSLKHPNIAMLFEPTVKAGWWWKVVHSSLDKIIPRHFHHS